jgi:hypothetical protein
MIIIHFHILIIASIAGNVKIDFFGGFARVKATRRKKLAISREICYNSEYGRAGNFLHIQIGKEMVNEEYLK